jgi:hypothetical protein
VEVLVKRAAGARFRAGLATAAAAAVAPGGDHFHNSFEGEKQRQPHDQGYNKVFHIDIPDFLFDALLKDRHYNFASFRTSPVEARSGIH